MKTIAINFKLLVEYVQGKLSREEEKMINFLLLSDEKNYWEFVQLRALKKADLLEKYLKEDINDDFLENLKEAQITQKQLTEYIKNKLTLEENQKVKTILSEDEKSNFEFIKLNALFEEEELDNYLDSKSSFVDSVLEKIQTQTKEYKINQDEMEEITLSKNRQNTKSISLKMYLSFAASFVLLMVFSFLIYDYVQEKQENKRLALENKKSTENENTENENTENSPPTNEYQTLGANENDNTENKIEDKLLLHVEDALDIFMANLSIVAKKNKEQKKQNSEQHLTMMKGYLSVETKISVVFSENTTKNIEFSDSETFFEWLLTQEKAKSILIRDYTAIIKEQEKNKGKEVIIKNGKIESSVPPNFSKTSNFKVSLINLTFEIE
jgi:predicted nucleic acid-binding Zn ribbon protein